MSKTNYKNRKNNHNNNQNKSFPKEVITNMNHYFNVGYYSFLDNKDLTYSNLNTKTEKESNDRFNIINKNKAIVNYKYSKNLLPVKNYTQKIKLKVTYPGLLIGIGNSHEVGITGEIKLGFTFDYVTGLPYIPGSSVKGTLLSAFAYQNFILDQLNGNEIINSMENKEQLVKLIADSIFGSNEDKPGTDVFMDSFVVPNNQSLLELDYLAPHHENPDLNNLSGVSVLVMLRVRPDSEINFEFILKDSNIVINDKTYTITIDEKLNLFEKIFKEFGVGAKTDVGYGYLV